MPEQEDEPWIRPATLDDAPAMARVLEAAFERWPAFEIDVPVVDHLRWKMSPPRVTPAHTVVAAAGEIVAVSIRWVTPVRAGDDRLVQDSGVDQAVLPSWQGRGLGGRMARLAHERAVEYSDMAVGTGSSDARIPSIFDRFDPPAVEHELPMRTRAFNPRAFLSVHRRGERGGELARNALRAVRRFARPRGVSSSARIEEFARFDERVDPLWEAFAARFEFMTDRTADYLDWRYADPAGGRCALIGAFEGDRMVGLVVAKPSDGWSKVLDLVVDPDHPRLGVLVRELLDAASRRMRDLGAAGADIALPVGHPLGRAVERAGFLPRGWSTHFTSGFQRRGHSSPTLERFYAGKARRHLTFGDVDIY